MSAGERIRLEQEQEQEHADIMAGKHRKELDAAAAVSKNDEFCIITRKFVLKTRTFVLKGGGEAEGGERGGQEDGT